MANPKELRDARRKLQQATTSLARIERLPRRVGSQVLWANGVLWTRAGDDDWRAEGMPDMRYPSEHVAWGEWQETYGA